MGTVARVTEISSTSEKSFEDAIAVGVARADETLRKIRAGWVKDQETVMLQASDRVDGPGSARRGRASLGARTTRRALRSFASLTLGAVVLAGAVVTVVTVGAAPAVAATTSPAIAAGDYDSCALFAAGTVKCWGDNSLGQIGDSTTIERTVPTLVHGLTGAKSIAVGYANVCALLTAGTVKCWGYNAFGQVGDGTTTDRHVPTTVPGLSGVTAIAAGDYNVCALLAAGTVRCWGDNRYGTMGNNTTSPYSTTPTSVTGLSGVTAITVGTYFACGLLADQTVKCWGINAHGDLGDGTIMERHVPTAVTGLTGVSAIAAGQFHTCAVLGDGTAKCWGSDQFGQLGDNGGPDTGVPTTVVGLTGVRAVSGGYFHTCALLTTGTMKCWGANFYGDLGDDTTTARVVPTPVTGLTGVVQMVAAGYSSTCALLSDGTGRCWGGNGQGVIGDGTVTERHVPTKVLGLNVLDTSSPAVAVSAPASPVTLSTAVGVKWSGTDPSGVDHFDVRRLTAVWNASPGAWTNWLSPTTTTSATYAGTYGRTYCFDVRAQDTVGNLSGRSAPRCTAVPLRSDEMSYSSAWTHTFSGLYFGGIAYKSTTHNATMTRTGVVAKRLYLVTTKCAACGTAQVKWNGTVIANLNLSNPSTLRRQVVALTSFSTAKSGTLTVTNTSTSGKAVIIEGLAVYNT